VFKWGGGKGQTLWLHHCVLCRKIGRVRLSANEVIAGRPNLEKLIPRQNLDLALAGLRES
jgi:hypothetical protein